MQSAAGLGGASEARASTRSPSASSSVSFTSSLRQKKALMCGKTAAREACLVDTKTTCRDARRRPEMPQKIFFQLELRLNFVWYTSREFPAMGALRAMEHEEELDSLLFGDML